MKNVILAILLLNTVAITLSCSSPETADELGVERALYAHVLEEEDGVKCISTDGYLVGTFSFQRAWWPDETDEVTLLNKNLLTGVHPNETEVLAELEAMGFVPTTLYFSLCSYYSPSTEEPNMFLDAGQ